MGDFVHTVLEAGGGTITLEVDRDLDVYPAPGTRVKIVRAAVMHAAPGAADVLPCCGSPIDAEDSTTLDPAEVACVGRAIPAADLRPWDLLLVAPPPPGGANSAGRAFVVGLHVVADNPDRLTVELDPLSRSGRYRAPFAVDEAVRVIRGLTAWKV